ncbi:AAA ATPase [Serendipita sp. 399]|nr:AAA ATPase [Serendipita sp. 399]
MPTVLGKRTRSNSNSTVASVHSQDSSRSSKSTATCVSPHKRQKTSEDDSKDANKENIPPLSAQEVSPAPETRPTRGPRRAVASITPRKAVGRRQFSRTESTPVIELGNLQLATPPVTPVKIRNEPSTIYAQTRALLRPSTTASVAFIGRQSERAVITKFFNNEATTCLYISGTPGTGKTALVSDIIKGQEPTLSSKYLNCMGMGVEDIKSIVRPIRDSNTDDKKLIMVLDELEHLDSTALASLATMSTMSFRIIGISNTHTLTSKSNASTLTLHFKPYTAQEMTDIITRRLETLSMPDGVKYIIAPAALNFACRKISSQTGDLRACLALVRGAVEMAEKDYVKKTLGSQGEDVSVVQTSMTHVLAATKANTSQAPGTIGIVRQLTIQARLVLLSLLLATRRITASLTLIPTLSKSGTPSKTAPKGKATETLTTDALFDFYTRLLSGSDAAFNPVSRNEFTDLVGLLETHGLLERGGNSAGKGKGKMSERAQIVGIPSTNREEEMVNGLTVCEAGAMEGPAEREIRSIWTKETTRIKREEEDKSLVLKKRKDAFDDACEA